MYRLRIYAHDCGTNLVYKRVASNLERLKNFAMAYADRFGSCNCCAMTVIITECADKYALSHSCVFYEELA